MKANEFVKKHGWEAVIEAVKTTPLDHDFQSTDLEPKLAKDGSIIGFDCKMYTISHAEVKRLVESHELVEKQGGLERVKKAIDGKHIGYTHFYLHSNGRYVFLDHYVDFIPDHAQHIGMFNKAIADVESCMEVS